MEHKQRYTMQELVEIIHILRKECPWDSVQTHQSLKNCLLEESYEVIETLDSGNGQAMADEMGDLLMQILLHAEIGQEEGEYTLEDVTTALAQKMIRRHPHIFCHEHENALSWEEIKKKEKNLSTHREILENISTYLPALQRGMKFSKKLQAWGDEKDDISQFCEKSKEILSKIEISKQCTETEMGELLYTISAICGHFDMSGELALNKFLKNFKKTLEK